MASNTAASVCIHTENKKAVLSQRGPRDEP